MMTGNGSDRRLPGDAASAIRRERLLDVLRLLCATPTPRGRERETAERLARWARETWPGLSWSVEAAGPDSAGVLSVSSPDPPRLLLYSHLDTSLSGDPLADTAITGRTDPAPPLSIDESRGVVRGFGLGVARAPAAAALLGYAAAAGALAEANVRPRLGLLLAAAGTHRAPWNGAGAPTGVTHHLATHPRPAAVLVAKCGPPGVLHEEPGAAYLRLRLRTDFGPLLAPAALRPPGGLLAHLGALWAALTGWRAAHLRARSPARGQIGAEVGVGCVASGSPGKPDVAPGMVDVHLYVMTVPGDDVAEIAASLREHLRRELRATALAEVRVVIDAHEVHPAASTPPDAAIVASATAAWRSVLEGTPPKISAWTGSTDGVVFRGAGCDVARVGPRPRPGDDPRTEVFDIEELLRFARLYAETAVRHALSD